MKLSIYLLVFVLMGCTSANNLSDSFFKKYNAHSIKTAPLTEKYTKSYVEDDFPEIGVKYKPVSNLSLKYDTLSHYIVIISGIVYFAHNDSLLCSNDIKKIQIKNISVLKRSPYHYLSFTKDNIPTKKNLPIPFLIMKKMKNDFLYTNRNMKIEIEKKYILSGDSFPVVNSYKLY